MHDSSRDLLLASVQQSAELQQSLDQVRSFAYIYIHKVWRDLDLVFLVTLDLFLASYSGPLNNLPVTGIRSVKGVSRRDQGTAVPTPQGESPGNGLQGV